MAQHLYERVSRGQGPSDEAAIYNRTSFRGYGDGTVGEHFMPAYKCPHAASVDLRAGVGAGLCGCGEERKVGKALERLHLDHERPLHATCHRWRAALPRLVCRGRGTTDRTARRSATPCLVCV